MTAPDHAAHTPAAPRLSDLMAQWPGALHIPADTPLAEIISRLDAAPDAPGLMVDAGGDSPVALSRRALTAGLTQTFSLDGPAKRPLAQFLAQWASPLLQLPADTPLGDAIRAAVARDAAARFDPVLITCPDAPALMVDLRVLLLAQCAALESAVTQVSAARLAAENAAAARTRFLVGLGHEIRTPMTAIVGFAADLADTALSPEERRGHGAAIRRNADHLMAIINDLLDASKIEAGKMTVERIACDPLRCIDEAMDMLRPAALARGLEFNRFVHDSIPGTINADPLRLRQILLNLLSNAIKFTEQGAIGVTVTHDKADSPPALRISVSDTGPGMTSQQCREVFAGFSQADHTITRRFGGSGLGLSISRQFAQLMGGRLTCNSAPGRGSTFTLTIPLLAAARAARPTMPTLPAAAPDPLRLPQPLKGLRILLAEDGPDNRRLLHSHLTRAGAELVLVADGFAAVQAAMAPEFGALSIDLILMDVEMPVLDGIQATRVLRSRRYNGPIIALTAHDDPDHRARCFEVGCSDHLVKPVDRAALIRAVARWTHAQQPQGQGRTPPAPPRHADAA